MGYKYYDYDEKRLQRKLIPLNIVVAIICLVAAISLMVTPFIQIDIGKAMSAMTEMEQGGSPSDPEPGDGSETVVEDTAMTDAVLGSIDGKIGFSPLMLGKLTFADGENKTATFLKSVLFDGGMFESMMNSLTNMTIITAIVGDDIEGIDYEALSKTLDKIDGAKTKEELGTALDEYVAKIEEQTGSKLDEDVKEEINEFRDTLWDETVKATGGEFSIEAMMCVFASKSMQEENPDAPVVTNYEDLFDGMMDGSIKMPGSGEGEGGGFDEVMKQFDEVLGQATDYLGYAFYAFCGFAGIWLILFLFAFFHTFAKNKRFTMWYVKIFGGIPCLIFGVALTVLGIPAVGAALFGAEAASMTAMLGAISSMTWISGGCYLLLWLVSIFWAFPIKRKIRRSRK